MKMTEAYQEQVEGAATDSSAQAAPAKKERKPRAEAAPKAPKLYPQWNEDGSPRIDETTGEQLMLETKMAKPKAPKVIEYQKDEDGNFILDEEGNQIPVKKTRAPSKRIVPTHEASVITISEEQAKRIVGYKGARGEYAAPLRDGQTIAEYLEAGGDRGFLRFYIRDGACSVEAYKPADAKTE